MDKQTILERLDMKALYSGEIPSLKWDSEGKGRGDCPFNENHKQSFSVAADNRGRWKCTECKREGDVFSYYRARYQANFSTAMKALEAKIPEAQKKAGEQATETERGFDLGEKLIEHAEGTATKTPGADKEQKDKPLDPLDFLRKGSDLQSLDIKIEWIIDKILPKQSITLLHGRGGIGKTWLSLILAEAISKGAQFMGLDTQSGPVVYVDFENSLPVLAERVRKIGIEDVLFWHTTNTDKAGESFPPPKLDNVLKWVQYKSLPAGSLLIFDTLRASQGQDENDSQKMASIMAKLKELRDMGFTILLLHHTPKGNDQTYKGSTAILDLADHVLSLHKVRKNNLNEEIHSEDDTDCLYRFGTKDKTRYEMFHTFMAFDPEKGFVKAADPDTEILESMAQILGERGELKTNAFCEAIKGELDIQGKSKALSLIHKGAGKLWTARKDGRAIIYEIMKDRSNSLPPICENADHTKEQSAESRTDALSETQKTPANSERSNSPGVFQTKGTEGVIDIEGIAE